MFDRFKFTGLNTLGMLRREATSMSRSGSGSVPLLEEVEDDEVELLEVVEEVEVLLEVLPEVLLEEVVVLEGGVVPVMQLPFTHC